MLLGCRVPELLVMAPAPETAGAFLFVRALVLIISHYKVVIS